MAELVKFVFRTTKCQFISVAAMRTGISIGITLPVFTDHVHEPRTPVSFWTHVLTARDHR